MDTKILKIILTIFIAFLYSEKINAQMNELIIEKVYDRQKKLYGYDRQKKKQMKWSGLDGFKKNRERALKLDSLSFINKCDTIFILEGYDFENGITSAAIWSKDKLIEYANDINGFNFVSDRNKSYILNPAIYKLVSDWDIKKIDREKEPGFLVIDINLFATRVILNGAKVKIDVLRFKSFDDFYRDLFLEMHRKEKERKKRR